MSGIRRLLAFISVAMIIETAAYSAITPLLPGFADDYDLSKAGAGVLTGAYPAGTLICSLPAAWIVSHVGTQRAVIGALLVFGAASLMFGLVQTEPLLIATRFVQGGAAAAIWAGTLAWIVAVAPRERRAEAIGTAIGAAIAGALGGPILGALADEIGHAPVFAGFFAVPLGLAIVLARQPAPRREPALGADAVRVSVGDPLVRRGIWLMALPAAAFGLFNVLVPLRLDDLGAGAKAIASVFLAAVVLESLMSPVAGRLADRRGALLPARVGLAAGGAALALLAAMAAAVPLALSVIAAAALFGLLWTPAIALLGEGAELRGVNPVFGFGLANLAWGLGVMLGGSGGGALASVTADAVPYAAVAAAAVITSVTLR